MRYVEAVRLLKGDTVVPKKTGILTYVTDVIIDKTNRDIWVLCNDDRKYHHTDIIHATILNRIDENGLDAESTVVRCTTQEEADLFLEYLQTKGVWDSKSVTRLKEKWEEYGSATCYHISHPRWCSDRFYKIHEPNFCIVDFCDIYKQADSIKTCDTSFRYEELFGY